MMTGTTAVRSSDLSCLKRFHAINAGHFDVEKQQDTLLAVPTTVDPLATDKIERLLSVAKTMYRPDEFSPSEIAPNQKRSTVVVFDQCD